MKFYKKILIRIINLIIVLSASHFVYSQDYNDKKTYYDPDSLSIVFFEGRGDYTWSNSLLTFEFNGINGEVFTYQLCCAGEELNNIKEARYLRKGNVNKKDANLFIDLIFDYKINWLPLNQENTKIHTNGVGEGSGLCAICIKKGSNYFSKTITYPGSDFRILNNEFVDFKREIYLNALKLTADIPLKELENIIFNTAESNFPLKEMENIYGNKESNFLRIKHNAMNFATEAVRYINDTAAIDEIILLFQKERQKLDYLDLSWSVLEVFKKMDNDKITCFLGSIIEENLLNKNETDCFMYMIGIINAIAAKSNIPLKTYYLKKCLLIDCNGANIIAAMELAKLNDDSGLNILFDQLNKDNFNYYELYSAFATFDKRSIPVVIAKYQAFKTNTSLSEEQKNNKMAEFLKLLNMLLDVKSKEKMCEYNFKTNLEKEIKELDVEIEKYQVK